MAPPGLEREIKAKKRWLGAPAEAATNVTDRDLAIWRSQGVDVTEQVAAVRARFQREAAAPVQTSPEPTDQHQP